MPKVLIKDIFIEIRHSLGRFCSIMAIVALGVAFFAGIKASAPDMKHSADTYFDTYSLQDIQVYSTIGLDKEDVEAIREIQGVKDVQPVFSIDALTYKDSSELVFKIFSLPDAQNINIVRLISGRMPEKENECLIEAPSVSNSLFEGFEIGDVIQLESGTSTPLDETLKNTAYTVVGTCYTPYYLSYEKGTSSIGAGEVNSFMFIPDGNIKADYYTEIDLSIAGAKDLDTYSQKYFDLVDPVLEKIEAIAGSQVQIRINGQQKKIDDARKELAEKTAEAQKELDDAKEEIDDGEKEIAENEAKLADAKTQIDDGQKEIDASQTQLDAAKQQIDAGWNEVHANETLLKNSKTKLDDGWKEIDANKNKLADALLQIQEGQKQIVENELKLADAKAQIDAGQKEIDANQKLLDEAKAQLDDGWKELNESKKQLEDAKEQLDAGWEEYYAGKKQLDDGIQQLQDKINEILQYKDQMDSLQSRLDQLKEDLRILDTEIPELSENGIDLSKMIEKIDVLQEKLRQLQNEEGNLNLSEEQLQAIHDEIRKIQAQLETMPEYQQLKENYQQIIDKLHELYEEKQETLEQYEELNALIGRILEGEKNLRTLQEQLNQMMDARDQLQEAYQTLSENQKKYDEGYAAYLDGQARLEAAQKEYDDGNAQLDAAKEELADAVKQYEDGMKQLEEAKAQLADAGSQYESGNAQLQNGIKELEEGQKAYDDGLQQLNDAKNQLNDAQKQYDDGLAALQAGRETLADSLGQYLSGISALNDARKQLQDGKDKYEEGVDQLQQETDKAQAEIDDAQKRVDELSGEWIVLDRNSHYSYRDYGACADRMDGIASVFPVFFFLVAALVCMTTMSRMVDEQRTEIGTLKALGYSKVQIAMKYLAYALLASLAGCVIGCAAGMLVFPYIIFYAWNTMYNLESIQYLFQPGLMVMASLSVTGIVLLATIYSIYRELVEVPSQLMRPKATTAGKKILLERIPWLWNKVSFLHKVTLRNIFRYKKRFLMTVIGISGCTALLVAGFGINDSISDIVNLQFVQIYHYDASMAADTEDNAEMLQQIQQTPGVKEIYEEQTVNASLTIKDKEQSATVHVIDDPKAFEDFTTLRSVSTGQEFLVEGSGAFINERMAVTMGVSEGDTFEMELPGDKTVSVQIAGIYENYVGHHIYVSPEQFAKWKVDPEDVSNTFLLQTEETTEEFEKNLGTQLMGLDGAKSVTFYSSLQENFLNMIGSIKMVVVVLVAAAAALAFVVLYNLSNINISERMREIATIKVLGFTEKEVNAYVNRESLLLALIGALAGLFIGVYLHQMIMSLAELDDVMFGRTISPLSYTISCLLTLLFAAAVNWVMKFKLRKIQMVESLKAVE